jgi:hypothetical protein
MAVEADSHHRLIVKEVLTLDQPHAADARTIHQLVGVERTLNADSAVPATKVSSGQVSLVAGVAVLDLTAAPGPTVNGSVTHIDFTGLKIQEVLIVAHENNTDRVKCLPNTTNGYNLFGSADSLVSMAAGEVSHHSFRNTLPDVTSGAKQIRFTSPDTDAKVDFLIVAG